MFANRAMGGLWRTGGRHNRERRRRVSAGIRRVSDTAAFVERARARAQPLDGTVIAGYRMLPSRFLEISHCVGFLTGRLLEPFALEGTVTICLRGAAAHTSSRAACRGRTRRVATMEAYRRAFIATGSFEPVKHVMVRAPSRGFAAYPVHRDISPDRIPNVHLPDVQRRRDRIPAGWRVSDGVRHGALHAPQVPRARGGCGARRGGGARRGKAQARGRGSPPAAAAALVGPSTRTRTSSRRRSRACATRSRR